MQADLLVVIAIAGAAALASPAGGLIALWHTPTTLFMSLALGFASGTLLATIAFEMLPEALELGSLLTAVGGFIAGFVAIYGLDLFVHRGQLAGEKSEQHPQVARFYHRRRPRGGEVTVLAGGTSAEELIEGLSIGVGAVIEPDLGLMIALAIVIDNLSEGLSIGEIIRSEQGAPRRRQTRRILGWTGLIGAAVFGSALAGWLLLGGLPEPVLGFLIAAGGGGMFYLTVTDLVPQAQEWHYQQSSAISMALGFTTIFTLSRFF
jgi:zinc transporter, ZIP family